MADFSFTDEPTCPYCGYVERDAWEVNFGGIEDETEHTCKSCGEEYFLSRTVYISYSTKSLKGQP